ncbi:hypothetical protein GOV12_04535, partial [Candidatus Pacearchaeota archaeon]|nr:hypothetical protein [Candidatus Pacearchaeota archaeon]
MINLFKNKMKQNKKRNKEIFIIGLVIILFLYYPVGVFAEDPPPFDQLPSDIYRATIPKHGTLQTNIFTGAGVYSFEFKLPPGTNNLKPRLGLFYNSHNTLGKRPKNLGSGWKISENFIQRNTNFSFDNSSNDMFELFLEGVFYKLIYVQNEGRYHTEIENFIYIKNISGGNNTKGEYWIVKTKNGKTYRFGYHNSSELISNLHDYVVRWSLDLVNDTYDNKIYYSYNEDPYLNDSGSVYPNKIEYNNDKSRIIEYIYEDLDRPDLRVVFEQGNKISLSRRLKIINITSNNYLVRKYVFEYETNKADIKSLSFISNITIYGNDNVNTLSPLFLKYYDTVTNFTNNTASWTFPDGEYFHKGFTNGGTSQGLRLADINGDGLIDLVKSYCNSGPEHCHDDPPDIKQDIWINTGNGWVNGTNWSLPPRIPFRANNYVDPGARLADINGDGLVDIVQLYYDYPSTEFIK